MTKRHLRCAVLTVSDRHTPATDSSGDYLSTQLEQAGHSVVARHIEANNVYALRQIFSTWIADPTIQVIISNGGTGFSHKKSTIAAVRPLLDQEIPGFGELFRQLSYADIGSACVQSDALAGSANSHFIFCLPGSGGACRLAWEKILNEQLNSQSKPCNFAQDYTQPSSMTQQHD